MELEGVIETALYTDDIDAMKAFYQDKLGLDLISGTKGRSLFFKIGRTMLIIFDRSYTEDQDISINGSIIPAHATKGRGHIAFEACDGDYEQHKQKIIDLNIEIESEIDWPSGKRSFYFRDPDQHSIEIVEYGFWERP